MYFRKITCLATTLIMLLTLKSVPPPGVVIHNKLPLNVFENGTKYK